MGDVLSAQVAAFCARLRSDHGFAIGQAEAHDALRALDTLGITDRTRVRAALRLICCAKRDEIDAFDDAFDRFFTQTLPGVAQPAYAPRHTRPGDERAPAAHDRDPPAERRGANTPEPEDDDGRRTGASERRPTAEESEAPGVAALRARFSPQATRGEPLVLGSAPDAAMLAAAGRWISAVRLGRSRRWSAMDRGGRFDLRRTVRSSLQTGGEPVVIRYRGHPPHNPRFAVLIDGSRSVGDRAEPVVAFARALLARSRRADAFAFSTEVRDITRALRDPLASALDLGCAWGGGTRIGQSLRAFVDTHGARVLSPDTIVVVFSDGLDVGDTRLLERAMHDIAQRAAAIVWLNPHAAERGFAPSARGMRAALPYLTLLAAADDAAAFSRLAERLARHPHVRGRRR